MDSGLEAFLRKHEKPRNAREPAVVKKLRESKQKKYIAAENLANAVLTQYGDKDGRAAIVTEFERIHEALRQNTAERAAAAVLGCLHKHAHGSNGLAVA